jgi:hypothetical protein
MSTHYGILQAIHVSPTNTARLNVASAFLGDVIFTVFPKTGAPIGDTVGMNPAQFATSYSSTNPAIKNLFSAAGGPNALVRVEFVVGESAAVLEEVVSDGKMSVALPPAEIAQGVSFTIPCGDLFQRTCVLIGNINPVNISVTPRYGSSSPLADIVIPPFGVASVPMAHGSSELSLIGEDPSLKYIVVLSVDTGTSPSLTSLTPR